MVQISTAIISASVALVVAFLTPTVTSLRARRQAIHDKFDAALAALLLAQAARHTPTGMAKQPSGWTPDEHRELNLRMSEKGLEFFVDCTAQAKRALAGVDQYVPEIREHLTKAWELAEADEPALRAAIERRRAAAVKAERLFRQRRALRR
ncbi:hypothetical protein [Micromonospora palythoicola]|uniref:hypothetical protein n=1 Tax=Micromonospora palythoicola TaxID=3120507 RepID=UPI002FCE2582